MFYLEYFTQKILSIQPDFLLSKSAIEESIIGINEAFTHYKVLFYLKFYCEINHIEHFWYNRKYWIRRNYKYSIERL